MFYAPVMPDTLIKARGKRLHKKVVTCLGVKIEDYLVRFAATGLVVTTKVYYIDVNEDLIFICVIVETCRKTLGPMF